MSNFEKVGWEYAFVPARVIMCKELSPTDVRVYAYLLWRQGRKSKSWPGIKKIKEDLSISDRQVKRSIAALVANNFLRRKRKLGSSSRSFIFSSQKACLRWDENKSKTPDFSSGATGGPLVGSGMAQQNENQGTRISNYSPLTRKEKDSIEGETVTEPEVGSSPPPISALPPPPTEPAVKVTRDQVEDLLIEFCAETGIPMPEWDDDKKAPANQRLWLTPLRNILKMCKGDSKLASQLVKETVKKMRSDGLTISMPKSIVNVAISIYGEKYGAKKRRTIGW